MTTEMDPPAGPSGPVRLVRFAPGKPTPAQLSARGRAALYYAEHFGWSVFPLHSMRGEGAPGGSCSCGKADCSRRAKHPRTPNGLKDATRDADTIERWWRQWPGANVGVRTGELEPGDPNSPRLVVLDIDPRHNGDDTFDELVALLGPLPDSVEALTGGGGRHLFLTGPEGVPVPCSVGTPERGLGPGVDVRGDGGYVVVAPSDHESGREYAWESSSRPDEVKLAPWPVAWMNRMLTAKGRSEEAGEGAAGGAGPLAGSAGEPIGEGGRNQTLFSRGCSMRRGGFDRAAILAALTAENDSRCVPPLPAAEVRAIVGSCMKYKPEGAKPTDGGAKTGAALAAAPTAAEGSESAGGESDWRSLLKRNPRGGGLSPSFGNLCLILRNDDPFKGRLRFNEMTLMAELDGLAVDEDAGIGRLREDFERRYSLEFAPANIQMAVATVAREDTYHPVREYITAREWDGQRRIARVAAEILDAHSEAPELLERKLTSFFVSAVARAMCPGEKVDTVLVLVGKQGARKSRFFRVLARDWFSDSYMDITNKDAYLQLHSAWIYEWGEVEKITSRRKADEVKAFLTSEHDNFRPPYARATRRVLRSGVMVGSTNEDRFLVDDTGNRRWWPVRVGQRINTELLAEWRDQLWAEAFHLYEDGYQWWLTEEEEARREAEDEQHRVRHPWEDAIGAWLVSGWRDLQRDKGVRFLTTHVVLTHAVLLAPRDMTDAAIKQAAKVLGKLGLVSVKRRLRGDEIARWEEVTGQRRETVWAWVRPGDEVQGGAEARVGGNNVDAEVADASE